MKFSRSELRSKLTESFRKDGLHKTLVKIARYILQLDKLKHGRHAKSLKEDSRLEIFTKIYRNNYWGSDESVSGSGSTIELTTNLRKMLPKLFAEFKINSVYDAPCGDFNWMKLVLKEANLTYVGADIVPALVEKLNNNYRSEKVQFLHADITNAAFPNADLWLCRDCLFHLSYGDIILALEAYVRSDIPFVLTSTHISNFKICNTDILTGGFRLIDLFEAPFYFSREPLLRIVDWIPPHAQREMCLWTRSQVAEVLPRLRRLVVL